MPLKGLSLVGFLDRDSAMEYLELACLFADPDPDLREQAYSEAHARLGEPFSHAGQPDIQSIPNEYSDYLKEVQRNPSFPSATEWANAWSFKVVEIDRLLAKQIHVTKEPVLTQGRPLSIPPAMDELLAICLPQTLEKVPGLHFLL